MGTTVERRDPQTGQWSFVASLVVHPHQVGAAAVDGAGNVYALGGWNPGHTAAVERFDARSGTWSPCDSLNVARNNAGAIVTGDGRLFVFGGDPSGARGSVEHVQLSNLAPTADAGLDVTVQEGVVVTLDGRGSKDPEGAALAYQWSQVGGPTATLNPDTAAEPSFTAPQVGPGGVTLTFRLIVGDGSACSAPDTVNVTVIDSNRAPVANAGDPLSVSEGSLVLLDGTASFDPDSDPVSFLWEQTQGTMVALSDSTSPTSSFLAPMVGPGGEDLHFALTVSDGQYSDMDTVVVSVQNVNQPPVADAGPDATVGEGTLVQLQGTVSDPDMDQVAVSWFQVAGPAVALQDAETLSPSFTAPVLLSGSVDLVFEQVADDGEATDTDTVVITVLDSNAPPVCDNARPSMEVLWPPNHKLVRVKILGVADPESTDLVVAVTVVTQDEPTSGLGDGDTPVDAVIAGDAVLLRAERSGTGNGRIYEVHFTATDELGQTCAGVVEVVVPHARKAAEPAVDDGQAFDATQ